jgi:hypothetical protein
VTQWSRPRRVLSEIMRGSQVAPRAAFSQDSRRVIRGNFPLPMITGRQRDPRPSWKMGRHVRRGCAGRLPAVVAILSCWSCNRAVVSLTSSRAPRGGSEVRNTEAARSEHVSAGAGGTETERRA